MIIKYFQKISKKLNLSQDFYNICIDALSTKNHGDYKKWQIVIDDIQKIKTSKIILDTDSPTICFDKAFINKQEMENIFKIFMPWRKGPFLINDLKINAEWRADLKFNRIIKKLGNMDNDIVLDVGSNNGYHLFRFAGKNVRFAVGIEPMVLFNMQFLLLQHFYNIKNICTLPVKLEQTPKNWTKFDKIFAMGVLYHTKSPIIFLEHLKTLLKPKGVLILETLIIEDDIKQLLMPHDRYAKMRNVWFIPSISMLKIWLGRIGFKEIEVIDIKQTTTDEQRATKWCEFESLVDFLDHDDKNLTIEGHPAPTRAILFCK
ncbi:MAG: tRNA 5-methoxyuridine(34)/uridine 5-oxyacetic acid(34) synthase CmoB [Gammaproteobacteria bacterium]|nr:MAG: tRNA 5-methoxyuridine(34)/uridine 5-oxyacetic acid(34) synthase CmoB [Gammaproteobacteria bacterium]